MIHWMFSSQSQLSSLLKVWHFKILNTTEKRPKIVKWQSCLSIIIISIIIINPCASCNEPRSKQSANVLEKWFKDNYVKANIFLIIYLDGIYLRNNNVIAELTASLHESFRAIGKTTLLVQWVTTAGMFSWPLQVNDRLQTTPLVESCKNIML